MTEEENKKSQEEVEVDPKDIEELEKEVQQKEQEEELRRKKTQEELLEKGIKQGKEEAMREYERMRREEQDKKEKEKLEKKISDLEKQLQEVPDKLSKEFEEKMNKLRSSRKGVSRNDSPFNRDDNMDESNNTPNFTEDEIKEIEKQSMEAFFTEELGRPAPSDK